MNAGVPPEAAATQLVLQCSTAYMVSSALQAAAKLKIADELADGPRTAADLARATRVDEDALYRVLRAPASIGIFEETGPRTFALKARAQLLRADAPGSVRDLVRWLRDPFVRVCAEMLHSVRRGGSLGTPQAAPHPGSSRSFNRATQVKYDGVLVDGGLHFTLRDLRRNPPV